MDQLLFVRSMKARRCLGITIASQNLVFKGIGFTGTYKFPYGLILREEISIPEVLAIGEELLAMQAHSRLMMGKFFYASLNMTGACDLRVEMFYDEIFGDGQEHLKQILPQFTGLMKRFTEWMCEPRGVKSDEDIVGA